MEDNIEEDAVKELHNYKESEEGTVPITPCFKEMEFVLNTLGSGTAEFQTPNIFGKIECIIINRVNEDTIISPVEVYAWLVEEEVQIIEMVSSCTAEYLPIRTETVFKSASEVSEYNVAHYYVNGPLFFKINGALNTEIKFRIRYKQ